MPQTLDDFSNFRWDIANDGSVTDGTSDAFDGGLRLSAFTSFSNNSVAGRTITSGSVTVDGVQIVRRVYVSDTGNWARFEDIFTNVSGAAITRTYSLQTDLGSDSGTQVVATQSGDLAVSIADAWVVTDDSGALNAGDPRVGIAFRDTSRPGSISALSLSGDDLNAGFSLTLAPGQTAVNLTFATQFYGRPGETSLEAFFGSLMNGVSPFLTGFDPALRASIVNFRTDPVVVFSDVTTTLAQTADNLVLTGFAPIAGIGNARGNDIRGNNANNEIRGAAGRDSIFGADGNDLILGEGVVGDNAIIRLSEAAFNPSASVITFDALDTVNPTYTVSVAGLGPVTVSTRGMFVGQVASPLPNSPDVVTLSDDTPTVGVPLTLDAAGPNVYITDDSAAPTSPTLSGIPRFNGPIAVLFSAPVAGVALTGGFFDAELSTQIRAFDIFGNVIGNVVNTQTGIEFFGLATADGTPRIAGLSFYINDLEPFGFGIDNLTFGSSTAINAFSDESDFLGGGFGDDTIFGEIGNDSLWGDEGNDLLFGGVGGDWLRGGVGNDTLDGQDDNDLIWGFDGADLLLGGGGDDTLEGEAGADTLYGWLGNDVILGGGDNDALYGEQGNDLLFGFFGFDVLFGGFGFDTLRGEQDNDTLLGEQGEDVLWGGDGDDVLYGWEWNDTLFGEAGNDTLFGEQDQDVLFGWLGRDVLWGGVGNDTLFGEQDNDLLFGEAGEDRLDGGDGADTLFGWEWNDTLLGDAGDDVLHGEQDNDALYGWTGNDVLWGGAGNDLMLGEAGDDTFIGGRGRDTMTGGQGVDRFFSAFSEIAAGEVDLITSYDAADRYLFQNGAQVQYFNFNAPGYGVGAGIHVQVAGGVFILDVFGATAAQLQAQTQFF
jgi:Ca2+-binding RTX toxin-like protein